MLLNRFPIEMLPPQAILLTNEIIMISLSENAHAASRRLFEGRVPYGTVSVEAASGPLQLAVCRLTEKERAQHIGEHSDEVAAMLAGFPSIISDEVAHIALSLDQASQIRLLNFLFGFCCKAFDLANDPNFARNCLSLVMLCAGAPKPIRPIATVSERWTVVQGMPSNVGTPLWSVSARQIRRLSTFDVNIIEQISVMDRVSVDEVVVAIGDKPSAWKIDPVSVGVRDLMRSLSGDDRLRAATMRVLIPYCERITATLREQALSSPAEVIRHLDFARPLAGALEAAISTGTGKMFLRGWLFDPHGLIDSLELVGISGTTLIEWKQFHRFFRSDLEQQVVNSISPLRGAKLGFLALVDDPSAGLSLQPTLRLRHKSGACTLLRPALHAPTAAEALTAVLTSIRAQDVTDQLFADCIAPAAATFHHSGLEHRGLPELVQIGLSPKTPHTSIIVPLYRNLSFIKYQIAALANDKTTATAQLIYVLDSPEQRKEVEHLLRGLHMINGMPVLLVVMSRNLGYAAANNVGATAATSDRILLLNSDVVPEKPGWLVKLKEALNDPNVGAVGPKLLFEDGSIQHAGLYFEKDMDGIWLNAHFHKGMPRYWPNAGKRCEVPGVTGAALLVRTADFNEVGGICEEYIIGDYEDSDFCLRIRKLGKRVIYVPEAELFHFERRSIKLHTVYSGTLACKYNQKLHHQRWDQTISTLNFSEHPRNSDLVEAK